jgi:NhaP-type Na+/H+ or K+/H+ antiporter
VDALTAAGVQSVANSEKRNNLVIMFIGFSSRTKEEHDFRLYLIIVVVVAAIVVTGIYVGIFIHENDRKSNEISNQQTDHIAAPSGAGNSLAPAGAFSAGTDVSTNLILPIPALVTATN